MIASTCVILTLCQVTVLSSLCIFPYLILTATGEVDRSVTIPFYEGTDRPERLMKKSKIMQLVKGGAVFQAQVAWF